MKQRAWLPAILVLVLGAVHINACSFSVEVLTPAADPSPTAARTSLPSTATQTAVQSTAIPSSMTPTLIPIKADTIQMLEIFENLELRDIVRSLAFTPDGTVLAAAGGNTEDFAIHLWEAGTGNVIGTLSGHSGIVWELAFSPDGQMLASVSSDGTAKIWDWRNGTVLQSLEFPHEVVSVRFSPDGQRLAVGGVDEPQNQSAAVWTFAVDSWKPMLKIPEYWNVTALAYSPDGRLLLGGGTSRNVQVWRTSDGTSIYTLNHAHQVLEAAVSPDSSTAATATCVATLNDECTEGGIWLWNLATGRLITKLAAFPDVIESLGFSVDGSTLMAASRDGTLRVYTTPDYQLKFEAAPPGGISALTLSPDGGLLATGSLNGEVRLWKIASRP